MTTIETNWEEIPAEYRFTAVDEFGSKWAYLCTPELSDCVWCCATPEDHMFIGYVDTYCENWRESLRERPSDTISVSLLDNCVTVTGASDLFMESNIVFSDGVGDIGVLKWGNGIIEFEGNAAESAKIFFGQLQLQFHSAIEQEIERRVKEIQK